MSREALLTTISVYRNPMFREEKLVIESNGLSNGLSNGGSFEMKSMIAIPRFLDHSML